MEGHFDGSVTIGVGLNNRHQFGIARSINLIDIVADCPYIHLNPWTGDVLDLAIDLFCGAYRHIHVPLKVG
jgi:hypothetical protein